MRRLSIGLLIALVTFVIGATAVLWLIPRLAPETALEQPAPDGWIQNEFWGYSFFIPPGMSSRNIQGTDGWIREYQNADMLVHMEYGITGDLNFNLFQAKQPEFKEEEVIINGQKAKWCTYRLGDSEADTFGDRERRYVVEMYFTEPRDRSRPIFSATCKSPAEQEIAKQIFRTVNVK